MEASGRSRVVLSLSELTPYTVRAEGNSVVVELDGPSGASARVKQAAASNIVKTSAPAPAAGRATPGQFSDIDFRRTETGSGRLVVDLGVDTAEVDVRSEGGKIVAIFRGIAPSDDMLARMDVLDFATPFKFIDVSRDGDDGRIAITPVSGAQFDQVAYQLGGSFTLELQPLSRQEQEERAREEPQFQGERLNVNFQNIEVRALLQIIRERFEGGKSPIGDLEQTIERVEAAKALVAQIKVAQAGAYAKFKNFVGTTPSTLQAVSYARGIPKRLAEVNSMALHNNPRVKAAIAETDASYFEQQQFRSTLFPQVYLEGSATRGEDLEVVVTVTLEDLASQEKLRVSLPMGKTVDVRLPPGAEPDQQIRLRGLGHEGALGGTPGDAILTLRIAAHPLFERDGANLKLDLPITLYDAVLGAKVRAPTLNGAVNVTVPKGSSGGKTLRLRGLDLTSKSGARGDLLVKLQIDLPHDLPDDFIEMMHRWREDAPYQPRKPA